MSQRPDRVDGDEDDGVGLNAAIATGFLGLGMVGDWRGSPILEVGDTSATPGTVTGLLVLSATVTLDCRACLHHIMLEMVCGTFYAMLQGTYTYRLGGPRFLRGRSWVQLMSRKMHP